MQVFTRGVDEGLMIGETVQINVLEVQATCVRLAIIDPDASPAYREEILYLPSDDDEVETSPVAFDEEYSFEDEDSRLIPMA